MQTSGTSEADLRAVWGVLADVEGWPDWSPTMDSVEPLEPGTVMGPGARYAIRQPRLPKAIWTVTDWQPDRSFTWVSRAPGITTTATHVLTPGVHGGTEIVLGLDWSGPLAGVARLLWGRLAQRYLDTEVRELAKRAASSTTPPA